MININELCLFLAEAKKSTYASGELAQISVENDSSKSIFYEKGSWKYHDNYFGGEPYGGREVVFYRNTVVYIMVYYGYISDKISEKQAIYKTLQNALLHVPKENPFRGPQLFNSDDFEYNNKFEGEITQFSGEETIKSIDGIVIYKAKYAGGLVDQK